MFQRLLTPIDMRHKDESAKAIRAGAWLARTTGAQYHFLTVQPPLGPHLSDMPEDREAAFTQFTAEQAAAHGVDIVPVFRSHESPSRVIPRVGGELDIDLIVMASHDPRLSDHIFASNASQTALHAHCSVMVVR